MLAIAPGCEFDVQRGPDWLIVRINDFNSDDFNPPPFGERIWSLLEQHFTYRLVLELDQVPLLSSSLVEQLYLLHRRIQEQGGVMRICGLSPYNQRVLRACRMDDSMPLYRDRREAVMGRPRQPR